MKSKERMGKLQDLSADELRREEGAMSEQMFRLRFQWAMGQTESLKRMRELRKDRARVLTILKQKESEK